MVVDYSLDTNAYFLWIIMIIIKFYDYYEPF